MLQALKKAAQRDVTHPSDFNHRTLFKIRPKQRFADRIGIRPQTKVFTIFSL
jgi:hypothetical protein